MAAKEAMIRHPKRWRSEHHQSPRGEVAELLVPGSNLHSTPLTLYKVASDEVAMIDDSVGEK